jgi:hypothetical protein
MKTTLILSSKNLSDEHLMDLTRELANTLNHETDVEVSLPEGRGGVGARGDAITLGQIILTALSSGTLVALFKVLKTYFERKPLLEVEFQRADGQKFKVVAEHLKKGQLDQTLKMASDFLGGLR